MGVFIILGLVSFVAACVGLACFVWLPGAPARWETGALIGIGILGLVATQVLFELHLRRAAK